MKRLILVRHAHALSGDDTMLDRERLLSQRGEREAPMMGRRLAMQRFKPGLVLSSPAQRALRTATLLATESGYAAEHITTRERIYEATAADLITLVQQLDEQHTDVMLVGHNPAITELAARLTSHHVEPLPTCGIFGMDLTVEQWQDVTEGCGTNIFYDTPGK